MFVCLFVHVHGYVHVPISNSLCVDMCVFFSFFLFVSRSLIKKYIVDNTLDDNHKETLADDRADCDAPFTDTFC